MYNEIEFNPLPGLSSGHLQTICAVFSPTGEAPPAEELIVPLKDGDFLSCHASTPLTWQQNQKTVVLIHGLGGSHESNYMIRMSRKLYDVGFKVVRINLRGCGTGVGFSNLPYNAGNSSDILDVLKELKRLSPFSPIVLVGYSLGGNIALKLAGELEEDASTYCQRVIAVCPPVDLEISVRNMTKGFNKFYQRYYLENLCKQASSWVKGRKIHTLNEFDDVVTAVAWGFKSGAEYYRLSSSNRFLPDIRLRCDILFAVDDPIIDYRLIEKTKISPNTNIWVARGGGHNGFLGWADNHGVHWLDRQLLAWICNDNSN
jgi:uncharacterized protein